MKKDLLSLKLLSNEEIMDILNTARAFRDNKFELDLSDKIIANLFFENSTRTQYSFIVAEEKLQAKGKDHHKSSTLRHMVSSHSNDKGNILR